MPQWLSLAGASLFFIKPVFSKKGSCPSKLGESLAMGIPVIASANIGDCDSIIAQNSVGVIVRDFTPSSYQRAIVSFLRIVKQKDLKKRCRNIALQQLSLQKGIAAYQEVYASLSVH